MKENMTDQILALLTAERDRLQRAIDALGGTAKRWGRPPGSGKTVLVFQGEEHEMKPILATRRERTPAERKAQSLRMRKLWAKRRKAAA